MCFSLGFLTSPFGAGAYKDPMATRLVLEFNVPPELLPHLQRLDKWVLTGAISQREVLFPDWSEQDVIKNIIPSYSIPISMTSGAVVRS